MSERRGYGGNKDAASVGDRFYFCRRQYHGSNHQQQFGDQRVNSRNCRSKTVAKNRARVGSVTFVSSHYYCTFCHLTTLYAYSASARL